jgi:L-aminopeptidase/D-esterase-like protein
MDTRFAMYFNMPALSYGPWGENSHGLDEWVAGVPRAVNPVYMAGDGDTLFALATGEVDAPLAVIGPLAAEVVADSIRSGVREATTLAGVPALRD